MKVSFESAFCCGTWDETGNATIIAIPEDLEARNRFAVALEDSSDERKEKVSTEGLVLVCECKNVFTQNEEYCIALEGEEGTWEFKYKKGSVKFEALLDAIISFLEAVISKADDNGASSVLGFIRKCKSACE